GSDLAIWDLALFQQANQEWPRNLQHARRLMRRQFRMHRRERHAVPTSHFSEDVNEHLERPQRNRDRLLWPVLGLDTDVNIRSVCDRKLSQPAPYAFDDLCIVLWHRRYKWRRPRFERAHSGHVEILLFLNYYSRTSAINATARGFAG